MQSSRRAVIFVAVLLFASLSGAQEAASPAAPRAPAVSSAPAEPAQVKFLFDWNQGRPWISYSILVRSDGKAHFDGDPNPVEGEGEDSFQQDFTVSEANRQKIFSTAKKLNYFNESFEFPKKIAQTGRKTLEYQSASGHGSATYNWSENKDIQELTRIFQAIATTLDYGRKLAFQYRFDKLGMDQQLRDLEQLVRPKATSRNWMRLSPSCRRSPMTQRSCTSAVGAPNIC